MKKIRCCLLLLGFLSLAMYSQTTEISGKIIASGDVEGIHVINKTSNTFTITNQKGNFTIPAKLNDTIVFSAVTFKPLEQRVDETIIRSKSMTVFLTELINELDEVVVGKILTGDLERDINNTDIQRPLDFYDVGIPGYTGPKATQNQQRLKEADGGKFFYVGLGFAVNTHKILNALTGRTKELKQRVAMEAKEDCLETIIAELSSTFFENNQLEPSRRMEFFYFCLEDSRFSEICNLKNDLKTLEFLEEKLLAYRANVKEKTD